MPTHKEYSFTKQSDKRKSFFPRKALFKKKEDRVERTSKEMPILKEQSLNEEERRGIEIILEGERKKLEQKKVNQGMKNREEEEEGKCTKQQEMFGEAADVAKSGKLDAASSGEIDKNIEKLLNFEKQLQSGPNDNISSERGKCLLLARKGQATNSSFISLRRIIKEISSNAQE